MLCTGTLVQSKVRRHLIQMTFGVPNVFFEDFVLGFLSQAWLDKCPCASQCRSSCVCRMPCVQTCLCTCLIHRFSTRTFTHNMSVHMSVSMSMHLCLSTSCFLAQGLARSGRRFADFHVKPDWVAAFSHAGLSTEHVVSSVHRAAASGRPNLWCSQLFT